MPDLFTPLAIGDLVLPNRIIMAPLTRSRATPERVATPMMIEHYVQRASAGLIITEATNIVPQSIAWDCAPGIYTREQIEAWAKLVRAVHDAGGRIALQLWHGGRVACDRSPAPQLALSPSGVNDDLDAIAPWGVGPEGTFVKLRATPSRAMTLEEIRRTIEAFGEAARACRDIGLTRSNCTTNGYRRTSSSRPISSGAKMNMAARQRSARASRSKFGAMMRHYPPVRVGLRSRPSPTTRRDRSGSGSGVSPPRSRANRRNGMDRACRYQFLVGKFERTRMPDWCARRSMAELS